MTLTDNELKEIRTLYPDLAEIELIHAPPKLLNCINYAKDFISSFCNNAVLPQNLLIYTFSNDLYTTWENNTAFTSACAINFENKNVVIVSPSILESFNEEKLIALLIHELIHLTTCAEDFMGSLDEEAFTEICSIAIQNKFLHSPDVPYVCEEYISKVKEVNEKIKTAGFDTNEVVTAFLDKRTNRSFIKNNFPEMYKYSLADIFSFL